MCSFSDAHNPIYTKTHRGTHTHTLPPTHIYVYVGIAYKTRSFLMLYYAICTLFQTHFEARDRTILIWDEIEHPSFIRFVSSDTHKKRDL